jgi:NAD+ synthase
VTVDLRRALALDHAAEVEKITSRLRSVLRDHLRCRGLVVAMSGGIDSSVSAALAVRALGKDRVFGLLLPERDSSSGSTVRGRQLAEHLGLEHLSVDIAPALEALGCYRWRDEAITAVFPEYGEGWRSKIIIDGGAQGRLNFYKLVVESPAGETFEKRMDVRNYLQIVAATNFKQRVRKTLEYFHADRLNYAVYKAQVYALARHLGLPPEICGAAPTTDTYSLAQGQDEFYFTLPYEQMDLALLAHNAGVPAEDAAPQIGLSPERTAFVFRDIEAKRRTTAMLHWPGITMERVEGPIAPPKLD